MPVFPGGFTSALAGNRQTRTNVTRVICRAEITLRVIDILESGERPVLSLRNPKMCTVCIVEVHLHDTLSSGKIGWYCLSSALNGLSTNLELFTQKSCPFAARLSLFQFSPQSGDFLPSFWTWSQTLSDYLPPPRNLVPDALRANPLHKPTDWIRPCSYGFINTRFLWLLFCFCQI